MSILKPEDGWDHNASKLLRRRLFEGSPDPTVNYAPDFRDGQPGPLTIQISQILRQHAGLWALEMRTRVNADDAIGRATWLVQMRQADAEIKRFVAGHTIGHGAAA